VTAAPGVATSPVLENTKIREIERELGRLRDESAEPGRGPNQRTSVMTHMAWVPERWVEAATRTLEGMQERHPSRTILLFPRPDERESSLAADVDLRCFARGAREGGVCFEVVQLCLNGERAHAPGSVVAPLLLPDLPVFLRWRGEPRFGEGELEQLVDLADRLVVDSSEWPEPEESYGRLPDLFENIVVSDIAWTRVEPWRYALAALWPGIADAAEVRVAGPRADALLLAGWLRGRLGRDVELHDEPAGEIELVEVDGEGVEAARAGEKSASDLLSDQLELFNRDPIYEEAVRSFSRVPT
jgi:glucose-6-phosphate dehydrogenase assembly protein OpcA